MSNFTDSRTQLLQARSQTEQARIALLQAQERVAQIRSRLTQFQRTLNLDNLEDSRRLEQLQAQLTQAEEQVQTESARLQRFKSLEGRALSVFAQVSDPRQQVNQCSDRVPFLLLPVRLETRFKVLTVAGVKRHQLWARVYPDDCAIDSFEPTLSESEIRSAQTYWIEMWKAHGVEAQERGAWRGLVASHGSGRAAWIVQHYEPLTPKPSGVADSAIVLVIPTTTPLGSAEGALKTYWKAVVQANGDRAQLETARTTFVNDLAAIPGGTTSADVLIQEYQPTNLDQASRDRAKQPDAEIRVEVLVFPSSEEVDSKQRSWTQPPKVNVLPDRFVLLGYVGKTKVIEKIGNPIPSPLTVGIDPSAPAADQLQPDENGNLIVGEAMRWMVDFEQAIQVGMGFKVDLTEAQAQQGFDRLFVLGLRLSADEQDSRIMLETLLQHHQYSSSGFSLLPQGTPTNNTEAAGAGFSRSDDADESFDLLFKQQEFEETENWVLQRDGQRLAESLGIDPALLQKVSYSNDTDQLEAHAMNTALWSATLGYSLETLMQPVLGDGAIENVRRYFNTFVSGRGLVPSIRIGNQPYGILPTTVFSRMNWLPNQVSNQDDVPRIAASTFPPFLTRLYEVLRLMQADWAEMAKTVSHVGKRGDAHKILLDVLGLHASSVEFHQRYAESLGHLYNRLNLAGFGGTWFAALTASNYTSSGMALLRKLGYDGEITPDILQKFFLSKQQILKGVVVDDRPLSETDLIRPYTTDGQKNYIEWLVDASRTSLETLRQQQGLKETPSALLYILLRHSLLLSYWDSSIRLHRQADLLSADALRAVQREPDFIHVKPQAESESRWQYLYKTESRITGDRSLLIADYIPRILTESAATRELNQQIAALENLKHVSTARLERLFAEHIDCCTYRLDAWLLGLVNYQLRSMGRRRTDNKPRGVYLGAYGWLENVRSENKTLTPVPLDRELDQVFNAGTDSPLLRDNSNAGYIHAPSLNHAVTAAVLRNGYLSNATPATPQTLAVNLSSERVRLALSILEGMRGGQSLGALLGYQLERGLHDRYGFIEVDEFIYALRKAFPLRADRLSSTKTEADVPIEAIEARNVVDGLSLVNHIKQTGNKVYPFGKSLPPAHSDQANAINAEVDRILDIHDAVADLAIAESVHQAVQGNYDRAAATLDTYSKGNFPTEPDVVQTPRSGITLTHRVGLHLRSGLNSAQSPVENIAMTPRAQAEPALNDWLATVLPDPAQVGCHVAIKNPVTGTTSDPILVTQQDLQLQPIDLLYLISTEQKSNLSELDDRILRHVLQTVTLRPDAEIIIRYTERLSGHISFFELMPLLQSLRSLALRSRPLRSGDIALHNEVKTAQEEVLVVNPERVTLVRDRLVNQLRPQLITFVAELEPLLTDLPNQRDQILTRIDSFVTTLIDCLETANRYGIPQTGWGFALQWQQQTFRGILQLVRELVDRWQQNLTQFDGLIEMYNNLPPEADDRTRNDLLKQAEPLISTVPTSPQPDTPEDLKLAILAKREPFVAKLDAWRDLLNTSSTTIASLLSTVQAQLPVTPFDFTSPDLSKIEAAIMTFAADILSTINSLIQAIDRRLSAANAALEQYNTSGKSTDQVAALQTAAKALLGEDFQIIPEFELITDQGEEWQKAWNTGDHLFRYLTETLKVDFPVDDWLYGVARVREKMGHWEQVVMLSGAMTGTEPELRPIQFPYKPDDYWLGLQFPSDDVPPEQRYVIDGDRLLYTAHYAQSFQKTQRQCGLLLDEWTEVIPGADETTGVTFHYDRPNSEPPQTMLLVTPSDFRGGWQWQDLVDTLHETLDLAKLRAVEPVQVDRTAYARFLPATVMAVTLYQISISANLALNNKIYDFIKSDQTNG